MATTSLRADHDSLPLIGISKWEGEEGGCAYAKAYMILNELSVIRVCFTREGRSWYMSCAKTENGYSFGNLPYKANDSNYHVNHCTPEVLAYAKEYGLIPEEYY